VNSRSQPTSSPDKVSERARRQSGQDAGPLLLCLLAGVVYLLVFFGLPPVRAVAGSVSAPVRAGRSSRSMPGQTFCARDDERHQGNVRPARGKDRAEASGSRISLGMGMHGRGIDASVYRYVPTAEDA